MGLNIGVFKVGANITQSGSIQTASNFDLFSLMPILTEAEHTVRIFTKVTRNTLINKPYKLHDYTKVDSLNKLDLVLLFNGPIQFYGGKEDPGIIKQWQLINSYIGPVWYVFTDSRYPFMQLWELMLLKEWHKKYDRDTIWVERDDIRYIYQGQNARENIECFPIDWAIMLNPPESIETPIVDRRYDLIYGGSNRDAKRKNKFHHYYLNENFFTLVFGSVKFEDKFGVVPPNVTKIGQVPHSQFIKKMSEGKSTIIIGDKFYQSQWYTLRMYESILAGCLTFIDRDFDTDRKFYKDDETLKELMYVTDYQDYRNKMDKIKEASIEQDIQRRQLISIKTMYSQRTYKQWFLDIVQS